MTGIIWYGYGNKQKALDKLDEIKYKYAITISDSDSLGRYVNKHITKEEFVQSVIIKEIYSHNNRKVYFCNHDYWSIVPTYSNSRGSCCNISYIDKDISPQTIEAIIMPSTKANPFHGYAFY